MAAGVPVRGLSSYCRECACPESTLVLGFAGLKLEEIPDAAKALREAGVDVISLAAGEPDFDTPDSARVAGIRAIAEGNTHYAESRGNRLLREDIAEKFTRHIWQGKRKSKRALLDAGADETRLKHLSNEPENTTQRRKAANRKRIF